MTVKINHITFDATDPWVLARFWAAATGFADDVDDPNLPEHDETALVSADDGTVLLFIRVPEEKTAKNRVHLDVAPTDITRDEEISRLVELGATFHNDRRNIDGTGWVVLLDPEGNEFCVERSDAERAQTSPAGDKQQ